LIGLDSAKEIRGFYLDFVVLDLEFVVPGLDSLSRDLDFVAGGFGLLGQTFTDDGPAWPELIWIIRAL
jgi:hypothetical protein